ncbi:MAG: DUF6263 family protein [Phycisphaerales bacterium JB052]
MMKYAAAGLACLTLPAIAAEPVQLQYKFDADAPTYFEMVQDMDQTQVMQGQNISTGTRIASLMKTELVEANDDGSILIATTTEQAKLDINAPGMNMSYDSTLASDKSKLSNPTIASMAGMVGLQVQLLIAPDGTILDVPNVDSIQASIDAMTDPAVKAGISPFADEAAIKAMNEMNFKLLPAEAVEVGDEWHREFVVPFAFGNLTTSFDLTLESVEDGIASITITGSVTMPAVQEQGMTMNLGNADVDGILKFNIEDGVQESYTMTTQMGMNATMEGMASPILTMDMTQKVTMTRVKK